MMGDGCHAMASDYLFLTNLYAASQSASKITAQCIPKWVRNLKRVAATIKPNQNKHYFKNKPCI